MGQELEFSVFSDRAAAVKRSQGALRLPGHALNLLESQDFPLHGLASLAVEPVSRARREKPLKIHPK